MPGCQVFVTTELAPLLPGGAGAVVGLLAERLRDEGLPVAVLLITPEPVTVPPDLAGHVEVVAPGECDAAAPIPALARSRAAGEALGRLARRRPVSRAEFVDFDGLGFWALCHRAELALAAVTLSVRFHGPVDLLADAMGVEACDWPPVRVMEAESLRMADAVVVPGQAIAELAVKRYALDRDRVVLGQPPVPPIEPVPRRPAGVPEFVTVGRLGEMKGSHDLVDAAVRLLDDGVEVSVRFLGGDGWSLTAQRPMREWLAERIPERHRGRLTFEGPVPRSRLGPALSSAWAVVVPSRFESFCLAAHEARALGHAVVVPDLAAFRGLLHHPTGALVYDGTADGLGQALRRIAADPALREALASSPLPPYTDPLGPYRAAPPTPRHPRVQAGLATAATKRVEAAIAAAVPPSRAGGAARAARRLLRGLPGPVARAAVRIVPRRAKDRFRRLADWRHEQARREDEQRRSQLTARIVGGAFPPLDTPEVSVVIPCYNQGGLLEGAIRSVFEQTFSSWEIVVVDDGSDDTATRAVLDGLSWPRTRLIRQANLGLPSARNTGMQMARGRFLVPLDADDELAPTFLERLHSTLEPRPEAAFAQCWAELFGDVSAIWVPRPYNPYQLLLSNSVVGCVLLRRAAWAAVGGYAEDMVDGNEDWDLWLRLLDRGWGQATVAEPLFRYRKHGISMSVETEANFEAARVAMPGRHPRLYTPDRVRALKVGHYPWVSVIAPPGAPSLAVQSLDDRQVLADVASATGKVVVDWTGVRAAAADTLRRLARALEDHPDAYAAVPLGPDGGPIAVRRWNVVDPDAEPDAVVEVALDADGERLDPASWRGRHPDPAWTVDTRSVPAGLAVQRQRPEEEGPFPSWLRAAWAEAGA
jgi:glycosyltransferase involved in cell wall biosynthesis/GT2 family glycosyltransferase